MKKRLIALLLAATFVLSLAACGSEDNGNSSAGGSGEPVEDVQDPAGSGLEDEKDPAASGEDSSAETDAGSSADTDEENDKPASSNSGSSGTSSKPGNNNSSNSKPQKPDNSGSTGGSSSGGSNSGSSGGSSSGGSSSSGSGSEGSGSSSVDLSAFYTSISSGEDFPAMLQLSDEELDVLYSGLTELKPKQYSVHTAAISAVNAEIAVVEVASSGDVQKAKDIFQARIDYQINEAFLYPFMVECWKNYAKIVTNGNYVMLVCMGTAEETDAVVSAFNGLFA